jgi:hypothetical protein
VIGEPVFQSAVDVSRAKRYINADPTPIHGALAALIVMKLALETRAGDMPLFLVDAMEEAVYLALKWIFLAAGETTAERRRTITEDHFRLSGLGLLSISSIGLEGGGAILSRSTLDESWISRWGKSQKPVNVLAAGYLAGAFAALTGQGLRSFAAKETKSIVMGDPVSEFVVRPRS